MFSVKVGLLKVDSFEGENKMAVTRDLDNKEKEWEILINVYKVKQ